MIRVLQVGLHNQDNPISRSLKEYEGVEVVYTNGDPGSFGTQCDMAVIAGAQCSHQKMWDVKAKYKEMGKPFIVCRTGFTEIQEKFEAALEQLKRRNQTREEIVALPSERRKLPKEILKRIYRLAADCKETGMTGDETAKMLTAEGFMKASGEDFQAHDIHNMWVRFKNHPEMVPPKQVKAEPPPPPEEPMNTKLARRDELIGKVLAMTHLDSADKLELVERVHRGLVIGTEAVDVQIKGDELHITKWEIDKPHSEFTLALTKSQARLLLTGIETIKTFASKEEK